MANNLVGANFRQELIDATRGERDLNEVSLKAREQLEAEIDQGNIELQEVKACPCGSKNLEPLASVDRFGLKFGSVICVDCGLVLTNPRMAEASLPYYYDKIYHPLNFGKEGLDELPFLFAEDQGQKIFRLIRSELNPEDDLRVLEIGSGTGSVLREFIDEAGASGFNAASAVGTEFSHECINISRDNNDGRNIEFVHGGLQEVIESGADKFNLIILSHVFEHFVRLDIELARISSLLEPDGRLYIEVPGIYQTHKAANYNFSFLGYLIHAHMYNFTAATLANIVCANGFYLAYINEHVEAVFRLSPETECKDSEVQSALANPYKDIIFYLALLDRDQEYFLAQDEKEKMLSVEVKQLTVKSRQKDFLIQQKDNRIKEREDRIKKKDNRIKIKNKLIHQKEKIIQEQNQTIVSLTAQVEEFLNLFLARVVRKISRKLSEWF